MTCKGQEDSNARFEEDPAAIFLKRDGQKQNVRKISRLTFESMVDGDDFLIPATLYEPEKANRNVILYVHGGGWVGEGVETHDALCRKIANILGTRVLSVEYRLVPQHRFPTALHDVFSVYCALSDHPSMDLEGIILAGDSAGGNLCASLCIKLREKGFPKLPMAQILFYPVLSNDFQSTSFQKFGNTIHLTESMMKWFVQMYTDKEFDDESTRNNKFIYPLLEDDMSVFPRTLIVSAQEDVLLDGQILFVSKLKRAGIETYQYTVDHTQHGFLTYGHDHWEIVATVLEEVKKALGEHR
ncbi:MAG: alpha/beta hydrolase [Holosporales bacterium]|jgi:acetyl esterase|nr:alpha/beta hydrolase [Holosporales bacterium]